MKLFYGICPREMSNHEHHYMFDNFENSVQLRKKKDTNTISWLKMMRFMT